MKQTMMKAAAILGGFAILGATLVGLTFETTKDRIVQNERDFLLRSLHEMVPPESHDNDILADIVMAQSKKLLGADIPLTIYRARKEGQAVAAIITTHAPDGYSGTIKVLVAVDFGGQIGGVRVLSHKETPGLGDKIEVERSDWIKAFYGHSLNAPDAQGWRVKKDGGIFDQFTGATITPRAVVKAVHKALKYYEVHKHEMYAATSAEVVIYD